MTYWFTTGIIIAMIHAYKEGLLDDIKPTPGAILGNLVGLCLTIIAWPIVLIKLLRK